MASRTMYVASSGLTLIVPFCERLSPPSNRSSRRCGSAAEASPRTAGSVGSSSGNGRSGAAGAHAIAPQLRLPHSWYLQRSALSPQAGSARGKLQLWRLSPRRRFDVAPTS